MNAIKVLVVDDSAFMRKVISDIINQAPGLEVLGQARDGQDALKKVKMLQPDVVTMDIEMPVMDGISALEQIMRQSPVPVIMLSSLTKKGAEQTITALELGAVEFIAKPSGQISLDMAKVQTELVSKIRIAAGARHDKIMPRVHKYPLPPKMEQQVQTPAKHFVKSLEKLVIIGTSTGGPKALHEVIPSLPGNLDAAVLVVQHMPPGFTKSLADRLNNISQLNVKEAEDKEEIKPGWVYIAPGSHHMLVKAGYEGNTKKLCIDLQDTPPVGGHRPAVNVMFKSVAEQFWSKIVAVIMTGMGNDGSDGLSGIKATKGKIIAEDQSTCVVYGMPKAAVATGLVDEVVALNKIGPAVVRMLDSLK